MQWITVATPSFATLDEIEAVLAQLTGPPEGMIARYIGHATDGQLRVVALWESKAHADRFLNETLSSAVAKAFGPEPSGLSQVIGVDVERTYVREPVG
jgi:hypothetical protein